MKELKPLKEYNLYSIVQTHYPPILDRDPVAAARSIIKKDIERNHKLLKETFEEIGEDEPFHEPLVHTILFSKENFLWFASMLKEFENILKLEEFKIPYNKCPEEMGIEAPIVYPPFYGAPLGKKKVTMSRPKPLSRKLPPINNYRIKYLMEDYDMSEFLYDCFPDWYLLRTTTIFEQYSEKTNVRVRVDYRNGEFHYFVAGASDNWKEILGVPADIDDVVAALIFRSYVED